jgi:hypothetical protein
MVGSGDDLAIFLFFLTTAFGFGFEAVRAETSPRRITFSVFSVWVLLAGIFWLQIKPLWPSFTAATISVATNPVCWFVVLMFIFAVFAFHKPRASAPSRLKCRELSSGTKQVEKLLTQESPKQKSEE